MALIGVNSGQEVGYRAVVIGLVGASGSGKSTLASTLADICRERTDLPGVSRLTLDNYYHDLGHLTHEQRAVTNFDHPQALEVERFERDLAQLKQGVDVEVPRYDFSEHLRSSVIDRVPARDLIVTDGLYLAFWLSVRSLIDLLVFVDTDLDVCLQRRLDRDTRERGRSHASVERAWAQCARPMFERYGASARVAADVVVSGEEDSRQVAESILGVLGF